MKKLVIYFFLLISTSGFAQEVVKPTCNVTGTTYFVDKTPTFYARFTLGMQHSSLPSETFSLPQMKSKYLETLSLKGIDTTKVIEDAVSYVLMGYTNKGTLYSYTTKSLIDFEKYMTVTTFGLQSYTSGCIILIDEKEAQELSKKAIANARIQATAIANGLGEDLGEIKTIQDYNQINTQILKSLYFDKNIGEHWYKVEVTFNLK